MCSSSDCTAACNVQIIYVLHSTTTCRTKQLCYSYFIRKCYSVCFNLYHPPMKGIDSAGEDRGTTLHYTTLPYTTLPYTTLPHLTLPYTTLRYSTPHYAEVNHTTLHCTILHYTALYYAILPYITLSQTAPLYTARCSALFCLSPQPLS